MLGMLNCTLRIVADFAVARNTNCPIIFKVVQNRAQTFDRTNRLNPAFPNQLFGIRFGYKFERRVFEFNRFDFSSTHKNAYSPKGARGTTILDSEVDGEFVAPIDAELE